MNKEEKFWEWFCAHQADYFEFDPADAVRREQLFDALAEELAKVDEDLSFEFGPKEAQREFVVSACGVLRAFPAVTALVSAAPALERWRVIAFRPRRDTAGTVSLGGRRVDTSKVRFQLLDNGKKAGIWLFVPGYDETKQMAYLLLDLALGEYDVTTKLGLIEIFPLEAMESQGHALAELPARFDALMARLS